jgi:uncharacterized membrane protein
MTRTAIVLATLLVTTTAGFAEDTPKQDAPKNECVAGDIKVAGTTDCARGPRARVRRTTSDKPGSFLSRGYDARVMAPTYLPGIAR